MRSGIVNSNETDEACTAGRTDVHGRPEKRGANGTTEMLYRKNGAIPGRNAVACLNVHDQHSKTCSGDAYAGGGNHAEQV